MTEPPSPTWDPNAAGHNPAEDARTSQPGYIPPQPGHPPSQRGPSQPGPPHPGPPQQPPGAEQGGYPPPAGYPEGGQPQGGHPPGGYQGGTPGGYQGGGYHQGPPPGGYPGAPQGYPGGSQGYPGAPQGGYPPGYSGPSGPPPVGYPTDDDRTWALIAHFGGAAGVIVGGLFGWVAPLVALRTRGSQSPIVRAHAVAALNFQLTWAIVAAIGYLTVCARIGGFLIAVAWLVGVIVGIVAGVRANEGRLFAYPVSIPMIK